MRTGHQLADGSFWSERAHEGKRPLRHTVIGAPERNDVGAPGRRLRKFDGRLDGVSTARRTKLDLCLVTKSRGKSAENVGDKAVLHRRRQIQGVEGQARTEDLLQRLDHLRVVMTER